MTKKIRSSKTRPVLSVLLPVYNAELFIAKSIKSILNQTYSNFELLIVDDCSTDATLTIINGFQDSRIKLFEKTKNTGYTESLNWGIDLAQGTFIARMDADDVSLPTRFEKQIEFLKKNKNISICGTGAYIDGGNFEFNYPQEHEQILINLLFGSSLIHPSIMGRRAIFKEYKYDVQKEPAEDYDLFTRLVAGGKHIANLKEKLLIYRIHSSQISLRQNQKQKNSAQLSMLRMFRLFNYNKGKFPDEYVKTYIYPESYISTTEFYDGMFFFKTLKNCEHPFLEALITDAIKRKAYNFFKSYARNNKLSKLQCLKLVFKNYKILVSKPTLKYLLNG